VGLFILSAVVHLAGAAARKAAAVLDNHVQTLVFSLLY